MQCYAAIYGASCIKILESFESRPQNWYRWAWVRALTEYCLATGFEMGRPPLQGVLFKYLKDLFRS
jgi:hypothetical protein